MVRFQTKQDFYWFSDEDTKKVIQRMNPGTDNLAIWTSNQMQQVWYRNMFFYYSNIIKPESWDTSLNFGGTQGELVEMLVPQARSLTRQLISIVTKQKLAFSVLADKTTSDVIKTSRLGSALVKDIIRKQQMDVLYENMYEHSLLTGLGFLYLRWRTDKGEFYIKDLQNVSHFKGDLEITAPSVWDVNFDSTIANPRDWYWVQVRTIHNRWDLIAQMPDLKEELMKVPSVKNQQSRLMVNYDLSPSDDDLIFVYNLYHKPTPALPEGRYIAYASEDAILYDGDNFYGCLPIEICRAEQVANTGYGYPYFSNLIPLQEMLDNTISTIATNNSTFGVQNVTTPRGSNVDVQQILGMNFIQYTPMEGGGGKPEPLQLTQSAPEAWKFIDTLNKFMLDLSMINSALRGDPPTGVTSGAAIATLTTTALESVASSSKAARDTLRRTMLRAIDIYKRMASVPRSLDVSIVGGQSYSDSFVGQDLDGIKDIEIIELNPIMQTQNGREMIADKLMTTGLITNVKGYFSVLEGAPPSELYENELSQEDLVKQENEALALGNERVVVINTDDHAYHIMMHSIDLNNPKTRNDPVRSERTLAHIAQHYQEALKIDPFFAAMVRTGKMPEGGPPAPMPPAPGTPGGAAEPPMGPGGSGKGPQSGPGGGQPAGPADPAQDMLNRGAQPGQEGGIV